MQLLCLISVDPLLVFKFIFVALLCTFLHWDWFLDAYTLRRVLLNWTSSLSLVHLSPVYFYLAIVNLGNPFKDHIRIDILDKTVLSKFLWILRSHEDVFHNDLVDLICFIHIIKLAFFVLLWLDLVEALTEVFFPLAKPLNILWEYTIEF